MTTRTAWECPRCQRMNAPHADHCDCAPDAPELVPPRTPAPPLPSPFKPYDSGGTTSVPSPNTIVLANTPPKPRTDYVS